MLKIGDQIRRRKTFTWTFFIHYMLSKHSSFLKKKLYILVKKKLVSPFTWLTQSMLLITSQVRMTCYWGILTWAPRARVNDTLLLSGQSSDMSIFTSVWYAFLNKSVMAFGIYAALFFLNQKGLSFILQSWKGILGIFTKPAIIILYQWILITNILKSLPNG